MLYTPELGDRICAEIADGKSVRSVCKMDGMPCKATLFNWLGQHADFRAKYDVAVLERAESYAEEIIDIADDGSNDWMSVNDPDNPGYRFNGEHAQRSKLRLEARKWICAKMKPKKYGDKLALGGADDLPAIAVQKIERVLIGANAKD